MVNPIRQLQNRRNPFGAVFPVLLVVLLLTGCAGGPLELETRHKPSEYQPIDFLKDKDIDFAEYIAQTKASIKANNILKRTPDQLLSISPSQMESEGFGVCEEHKRTGVLLIHGLTDTPYLMRDIATSIISENDCVLVRSIILPGHGTVPGDLLDVSYTDWVEVTNYGVKSFIDDGIQNILIAGFSTGGSLALNFVLNAADHPHIKPNVKGLLLFSPAIRIKAWGGFLANWHKAISWAFPKRAWFDILEDNDFAKYESFPKNAADQIHLLTKKIDMEKGNILSAPLFVVISSDDDTIDSEQTEHFFVIRSNTRSRLIKYTRDVKKTDECQFTNSIICSMPSEYAELNIKSLAHTSTPISPGNVHYGKNGIYRSCSHYLDEEEYEACISDDIDKFELGEKSLYEEKVTNKPIRRLTFNPDFEHMTKMMNEFIGSNR